MIRSRQRNDFLSSLRSRRMIRNRHRYDFHKSLGIGFYRIQTLLFLGSDCLPYRTGIWTISQLNRVQIQKEVISDLKSENQVFSSRYGSPYDWFLDRDMYCKPFLKLDFTTHDKIKSLSEFGPKIEQIFANFRNNFLGGNLEMMKREKLTFFSTISVFSLEYSAAHAAFASHPFGSN